MSMPRPREVYGEQWDVCDRCGFDHPISMLTVQRGLKLCSDHGCLDDLDVERRQLMIQEILSSGEEQQDKRGEVYNDSEDILL